MGLRAPPTRRADPILERVRAAGWEIRRVYAHLPPHASGQAGELLFVGHERSLNARADRLATAHIPWETKAPVRVSDGW